ncbi:hypothetical protein C4D60_Mb03t22550 [Musa balbisiana]|uniref:Thiolase C-terminal domain-containing protein n=1 Tax=Musa balbisiana TaxID=52838 RepID=A0A4S8JBS6_MUSBA|nr:hypothetical protein C4D60_Mb03t22550 [Musa balbisiana]
MYSSPFYLRFQVSVQSPYQSLVTSVCICDGAAALVLVSGKKALELGLQVIAKIRGYADAAHAPELFTTAPALAIPKAISNAGLEASQVDYYEINEAFSTTAGSLDRSSPYNQSFLSTPFCRRPSKSKASSLPSVSPWIKLMFMGGAVSLGHPLGCSGARSTGHLARVLAFIHLKTGVRCFETKKRKIGVAGVCNGGGGASALILELL